MIDVMSELDAVKTKTGAALRAAEADPDASVVLVAVVREFDQKAAKAGRIADGDGAARDAVIELEQAGDSVRLSVSDDGAGFDAGGTAAPRASWGLRTMRERAEAIGTALRIDSAPGKGTRVVVEVNREAGA